jgi:2-polyprenyl-3-methyl-5-hydroxy-6-metoxy-1,4-benzoquinol methylase
MQSAIDPERLKEFAKQVFDQMSGAAVSALIYLGDHLGLFRALAEGGPATSEELAGRTGLQERWLREWLQGMGAARLLDYHGAGRFGLSAEAACVLADEDHPAFGAGMFSQLPRQMAVLDRLPESFRTGLGLPYDSLGAEGAVGVERGFAPWYRNLLVPYALPRLEGVVEKLGAGARVADVGCGTGVALLVMARAYPRSEFHGYEISSHALERAEENRQAEGCENVHFHDAGGEGVPPDASFDFVTTFDCLHDMTRPDEVVRAIRATMRDDGTWLLVDVKARRSYEENVEKNPMAAMMYGFSVLTCMSSALSRPDGMGLGTLGFHEDLARQICREAGFRRFRRAAIDHPVNAFYEVRP